MLPARARLTRRQDFSETLRRGPGRARVAAECLVVHLRRSLDEHAESTTPHSPESAPRIGFVVSRAVGNAVTRNRVKRRLRELSRSALSELPAGTSVVVRALPPAAQASWRRLGADFEAALAGALRRSAAGVR